MLHHTLNVWLAYIEKLHPNPIELELDRVQIVGKRLELLNPTCPVIAVAGTNGKGSCVTILESILACQGYRVGAYLSPHLERYNERIHIGGNQATDQALCEAFAAIELARQNISLTYFEWGTLAALWLFKKAQLDILILEVGLGGRLDAVNIVDADIAVITTIDLDHTEWLGVDRESIGKEKAGVFRPEKPAVCGDLNPPQSVYEAALALKTPLYCQGTHFGYTVSGENWQFWRETITSDLLPIPPLLLQNAATALMALELLKSELFISIEAIKQGLAKAFLPGRFQILAKHPMIILDVAHNPEGSRKLCEQLKMTPVKGKTHAVVGMLKDKNHPQSLKPLVACVDKWYTATLECERSASSESLAKTLSTLNAADISQFQTIAQAYKTVLNHATVHDRIVVFGSFYAVSPILQAMKNN